MHYNALGMVSEEVRGLLSREVSHVCAAEVRLVQLGRHRLDPPGGVLASPLLGIPGNGRSRLSWFHRVRAALLSQEAGSGADRRTGPPHPGALMDCGLRPVLG